GLLHMLQPLVGRLEVVLVLEDLARRIVEQPHAFIGVDHRVHSPDGKQGGGDHRPKHGRRTFHTGFLLDLRGEYYVEAGGSCSSAGGCNTLPVPTRIAKTMRTPKRASAITSLALSQGICGKRAPDNLDCTWP